VAGDATFLVEDFVEAIALQLDRVQDALAIKAEVRPLTYALKDFALQLHVFVELDDQGQVRFRNSGPNEAGSSVVSMDFTTITTPMIRENTISLAQARGPTLQEAGLSPREQLQLGRIGVRTLRQLQQLGAVTGQRNIARLAGLPVDRIQQAIMQGRPQVIKVQPQPSPSPADGGGADRPVEVGPAVRVSPPMAGEPRVAIGDLPSRLQPGPPGARFVIQGLNLLEDGMPAVRLNDRPLAIAQADDDALTIHVPPGSSSGELQIELPSGETLAYHLTLPDSEPNGHPAESA
jgi:hypothetical protein